jgi:tryptophan synthase alpha chain
MIRGSLDKDGKATPRTVKAVADLVTAMSRGVRGARQRAAE